MADLDDFVTTDTDLDLSVVESAEFGKCLVLSGTSGVFGASELTRVYGNAADVAADWSASDPEYIWGRKAIANEGVTIGKMTDPPALVYDIIVTSTVAETVYSFSVNGQEVTYTSDNAPTSSQDEVVTGLKANLDGLAIAHLTTSLAGTAGSKTLRLTWGAGYYGYVALEDGDGIDFGPHGKNLLSVAALTDEPNTDIADQLDAIKMERDDWYVILNPYPGKNLNTAIAAWAAENKKIYIQADPTSEIATVADGSATDVAKALKTSGYDRASIIYHTKPVEAADAVWAGLMLPAPPGSETWALATLSGVSATKLSPTHKANILAKNANSYRLVGSKGRVQWGTMADGSFIDQRRMVDALEARLQERVFDRLAGASPRKVAGNDKGILKIYGAIKEVFEEMSTGPDAAFESYSITIPKQKDRSSSDKATRNLSGFRYTAVPTSAIHTVKPISGSISL